MLHKAGELIKAAFDFKYRKKKWFFKLDSFLTDSFPSHSEELARNLATLISDATIEDFVTFFSLVCLFISFLFHFIVTTFSHFFLVFSA